MNGDFTRFSFRPKKHYSGVLMQQGRVQLDSDWNELVQIMQHRIEQQAIDTIGACGVPKPPLGQAAPFTVTAQDDGSLQLQPGRIYVDGLLCELESDAVQDLPTVNLPVGTRSTTALVFLDVWQRHVSAIEDGSLRESALGGPDTTTRMQTAWAVRINPHPTPSRDCDAITDLPPTSTGTLSTHQAAATATTPCVVGAKGGYAGLENRLYRVEIHQAEAGTQPAAFKWSRDNNAIGLAVTDFPTTDSVTVSRLGRDDVTRFLHHWIEVIGDQSESAAAAGTLAQVVSIDPIGGILKLDRDVSRHKNESNPRVRRWDMPPAAGSSPPQGAIPITTMATPAMLDPSVGVSFDGPAGGGAPHFQAGDYWTFTARTAEGTVESLTNAPPQGIQHHYCKLAWVTLTRTRDGNILVGVLPCSHPFPPLTDLPPAGADGCCVRLVASNKVDLGARLQLTVDELARTGGGCVCLPPGVQILERPVKIEAPPSVRITICGCGGTSRLVYLPSEGVTDPAFLVTDRQSVVLREFGLIAAGAYALVSVGHLSELTVEGCRLINLPVGPSFAPCIKASEQVRLTVRHCDLVGGVGIFESADLSSNYPKGLSVQVQGCRFLARLIGAYLELPVASSFKGCEIIGVTDSDWLVLNATASGLPASASNLERLIEGLFDAVRTNLSGYHLPIGLGLVAGSETNISDCEIRAGVGLLTLFSSNEKLYRNQMYGLIGLATLMTDRMDVVDNRISTAMCATLATGQIQWWRALENAIFYPPPLRGMVFARSSTGDFVVRAALRAFVDGLRTFKTGPDAILVSGLPFDPKPSAWPGASALLETLQYQYGWYRKQIMGEQNWGLLNRCRVEGNAIAARLVGVSVEPHVQTSQVRIARNRIDGPVVAGIRIRGLAFGAPYGALASMVNQVEANRCQLSGSGIDVAITNCAVSSNHIDVSILSNVLPDLRALQDLAGVLGIVPDPVQAPPFDLNNYSVLRLLLDQATDVIRGGLSSQQRQGLTSVLSVLRTALNSANLYVTGLVDRCLSLLSAADNDVAVADAFFIISDVLVGGLDNVGIRLGAPLTRASDNTIGAGATARGGILIDVQPQTPVLRSTLVEVCDNRVSGGAGHGVEIRNAGTAMRINGNVVDRMVGNGITTVGHLPDMVQGIDVAGNRIIGCRSAASSVLAAIDSAGVLLDGGHECQIVDNTITRTATTDPLVGIAFGISVYGVTDVMIRGNTVTQNGAPVNLGGGIGMWGFTHAIVANNQLVDNTCRAFGIVQLVDAAASATVTGNTLKGDRNRPDVPWLGAIFCPDVIFSNNHIVYTQKVADGTIFIRANNLAALGNIWNQDGLALDYAQLNSPGRFNVIGNISRSPDSWPHRQDALQNVEHNVYQNAPSVHSGVGAPVIGSNPQNPRGGDLYIRLGAGNQQGTHIYYFDGLFWIGIA
jgi:hypothetical protein